MSNSNVDFQQFGEYKLLRLIGSGSYADVYKARHLLLGREVAVKVFKAPISSEDELNCFQREAQLYQQVRHPHVIQVYKYDVRDGCPYIVMDYAPKGSLRDSLLKKELQSLSTVISIIMQIANALQYVRNRGIIHQDVKPENILIGENDQVMLGDFGIAMNVGCHAEERGTLTYMAPERFERREGPASDQYALACIAYEMLTGRTPFIGSPHEKWVSWAAKHRQEKPPALACFNPSIPQEVEHVVLKALSKDPEQRYVDIITFAAALQVAGERSKERKKIYPITRYKQRLEDYERILRAENSQYPEYPMEEEIQSPLLECLTKPYTEKALAQLSWVERSCLLLNIDAQFTAVEIAQIMNIEEQSVHQYLESGRVKLLQTYTALLEKEQGIAPSRIPTSFEKESQRAECLVRQFLQ